MENNNLYRMEKNLYKLLIKLINSKDIYEFTNILELYQTINIEINKDNLKKINENNKILHQLLKNNKFYKKSLNLIKNSYCTSNNYIESNEEIINNLTYPYLEGISKFKEEIGIKKPLKTLTELEIVNILYTYYKNINQTSLDIFLRVINNILIKPASKDEALSIYCYNILEDKIILLKDQKEYTTLDLLKIVHEIEHLKFYKIKDKNKTEKERYEKYLFNPYIEINTYIEEKRFLEYLTKNNILKSDAKILLLKHYESLAYYIISIKKDITHKTDNLEFLYNMYISDLILELSNYDYNKALEESYEIIDKSKNNKIFKKEINSYKKYIGNILTNQYGKITGL